MLNQDKTRTVVGADANSPDDLFLYGDIDGGSDKARLQHPLAVAYIDKGKYKDMVIISGNVTVPVLGIHSNVDTYNHKIKLVNPIKNTSKTLVGQQPNTFNEPTALLQLNETTLLICDSNNHKLKQLDLNTLQLKDFNLNFSTFSSRNTTAPMKPLLNREKTPIVHKTASFKPNVASQIDIKLNIPAGCHLSAEAPSKWQLLPVSNVSVKDFQIHSGPISDTLIPIPINLSESATIQFECMVYFCKDEEETCLADSLLLELKLEPNDAADTKIIISHDFVL